MRETKRENKIVRERERKREKENERDKKKDLIQILQSFILFPQMKGTKEIN